jgi:hypothetical protein
MSRVRSEGHVQSGVRVGPAGPGRASQGRGGQEGQPWSRACPGWVAARVEAECDAWCEVKWRDRGAGRATISCQPVAAVVRGSRAGSCRDIHPLWPLGRACQMSQGRAVLKSKASACLMARRSGRSLGGVRKPAGRNRCVCGQARGRGEEPCQKSKCRTARKWPAGLDCAETNRGEHGRRIARWIGPTRVREASMAECHQGEEAAYGTTRMPCAWSA